MSTRSEQQPLEESDDIYCSLCNKYHGINSQTMSPGKDIYKLTNRLSYKNAVEKNTNIYNVESFMIMCVCDILYSHIGLHSLGKRSITFNSEVPQKV